MTTAEKLKLLCIENAQEKYGNILPKVVRERLMEEFGKIDRYDRWKDFETARDFVQKLESAGISFMAGGAVGASFVSYLLGLCRVNPLQKFEHNGMKYSEGEDICSESFLGLEGEKNTHFSFVIDKNVTNAVENRDFEGKIDIFYFNKFGEKYATDTMCREDVYYFLQEKGLGKKEAFEISEFVRMGKASSTGFSNDQIEKMRRNNVPEEWIKNMKNVRYLPSKAFVIEENMAQ